MGIDYTKRPASKPPAEAPPAPPSAAPAAGSPGGVSLSKVRLTKAAPTVSLSKHGDLPNVPLIMDLAKTSEQQQIFKLVFARQPMGRPFLAPPGIPADRTAALRKTFMDSMTDPGFLAEADKMKLEINPVSGEAVQEIVQEVYRTPKSIAAAVADMVNR